MMIPELDPFFVRKFGRNADADSGDDVWDGSAAYPFPAAAAATTIVSDSGDDAAGGTGAITVEVQGLDADYAAVAEIATLNGTSAVNMTNQFFRSHRAIVKTAGTGAVNAGNVQVKHAASVITQITASMGQTLMSVYTLPADTYGWMNQWQATSDGVGASVMAFQARPLGGAWNTKEIAILDTNGNSSFVDDWSPWVRFDPKTDFRVRVLTGANNLDVTASFTMHLNRASSLEFIGP